MASRRPAARKVSLRDTAIEDAFAPGAIGKPDDVQVAAARRRRCRRRDAGSRRSPSRRRSRAALGRRPDAAMAKSRMLRPNTWRQKATGPRRPRQAGAAALATVLGHLAVGPEGRAAVGGAARRRGRRRSAATCSPVLPLRLRASSQVTATPPRPSTASESKRWLIDLAIVVEDDGRREGPAAIGRAGVADMRRHRLGQSLRPGQMHRAVGADGNLRPVFAVRHDRFRLRRGHHGAKRKLLPPSTECDTCRRRFSTRTSQRRPSRVERCADRQRPGKRHALVPRALPARLRVVRGRGMACMLLGRCKLRQQRHGQQA
jgi:hypothetical protein